ncbi:MAG: DUF1080 domain-containing protein [Pseudohongiellaceae bacterium]|nr:DUF1080 domain-containing protein [Pseudohongiellaceae bacterium]
MKALVSLYTLLLGMTLSLTSLAQDDWTTLIDGNQGLENFTLVGGANWRTADDAIEAVEGNGTGFLLTKNSYDNFKLLIEFWVSDDANSGIYMRCQDPEALTDRSCYEANIYDQRADLSYGTGGIVHIAPVSEPYPKAGGQWNTYEITLQNEHLIVSLNGVQTAHAIDTQFAHGPIGLQWARGTVRFRKVLIQPL